MINTQPKVNFKFRIPYNELCPKCKEVLLQRKREQARVNNRKFMALFRFKNRKVKK